jgi:uncharacterized membrane protein
MHDLNLGQKISDGITHFVGSWKFIAIFSIVLAVWIALNTIDFFSFDPYPFILLNLFLSFIAAFQAPFIMMSQNRSEHKQEQEHRKLFQEIKELVNNSIEIEETMMELIKTNHEDEGSYRKELAELTLTIKKIIKDDRKEESQNRTELADLTKTIIRMVEMHHSDEMQCKTEIIQLIKAIGEVKESLKS